jgi:hypothetical protein
MTTILLALAAVVIFIWNADFSEPAVHGKTAASGRRFPHQSWRRLRHNIDEVFCFWFIFASILSPVLLLEPSSFWTAKGFWKNPEGVFLLTFLGIGAVFSIAYLARLVFQAMPEVRHEIDAGESSRMA